MDEKLKSENTQKEQFSEWGGGEVIRVLVGQADDYYYCFFIIVTITDQYPSSRVSLFIFSKFSSPQAARGH